MGKSQELMSVVIYGDSCIKLTPKNLPTMRHPPARNPLYPNNYNHLLPITCVMNDVWVKKEILRDLLDIKGTLSFISCITAMLYRKGN